tara:strand:+ start:558 stop:1811 length:1254 start_codon:yes stop_codon:yes gene_type:complete
MTSQYSGNNMQLQYDPETQQWSYVNVAQTFIDTATFSSTDPQFQYGSNNQQDDNQEDDADADPCPPGYRLVTLSDGSVTCEMIEPVQQDRGGDDERPEPPRPDPFEQNKEAIESFFELKNEGKIDFNTYNAKTNLVEYTSNPNESVAGQVFNAFVPFASGIAYIENAMDEGELRRAGMLVKDENGKQFINLRVVHDVMKTKVMNPGVPEGNVLANTPGYYGLEDSNNYYKDVLENMNIKEEDMTMFGSTKVGIISDELVKSEDKFKNSKSNFGDFSVMGNTYFYKGKRLNQGEVNKLIQSGIKNPKDIVAEIEKDRQKYTEFLRQPATGDTVSIGDSGQEADQGDGGDDTPPIRPEGTTEPGSGYQAGAPQYTRPAGTTQPGSGYQAGAAQYTQSAARSRAKKAAEKLGTKLATGGR